VIEARFELAFVKALRKHFAIKNQVERKVRMIMEHPLAMGEPLKGNLRGFYSCPVKKSYLIIYLFCDACRKKGDDASVACSDCAASPDMLIKFVLLAPHDDAYASAAAP
jgi:mRNA-degrading endonuclease YafQ of YafQ-DinJ toxin-antitoxin module